MNSLSEDALEGERDGKSRVLLMLENTAALAARVAGLVLLLVGVWGAVQVLGEAWDLYRNPDAVTRFAEAVERGTHIDRILVPGNRQALASGEGSYPATGDDFRPSHILGWVLAVVLLLLLGRLAFWILMAGSALAGPAGWVKRKAGNS